MRYVGLMGKQSVVKCLLEENNVVFLFSRLGGSFHSTQIVSMRKCWMKIDMDSGNGNILEGRRTTQLSIGIINISIPIHYTVVNGA